MTKYRIFDPEQSNNWFDLEINHHISGYINGKMGSYYVQDRDNSHFYVITAYNVDTKEFEYHCMDAGSWLGLDYDGYPSREDYVFKTREEVVGHSSNAKYQLPTTKPDKDYIIV